MPKIVKFTKEQLDQMVAMHSSGMLIKEIATAFNTSNSTIARRLRTQGVISRHPSVTKEREQLAIDYYEEFHNLHEVSEHIHMNDRTVKEILIKNGVHVLSMSEIKKTCVIDESYFDVIDTHRKAYFLGLLYADGTVSASTSTVQISLQERDVEILKIFRDELKTNYKLSCLKYNEKNPNWQNQYYIAMTNSRIHEALVAHGVIPNKSLKLTFPKMLDEQFYSSFLLGYMDGDGNISKNSKDRRCSLVSTEMFCLTVADIIKNTLNVNSSILLCHNNSNVTTRVLQIAGNHQVKKFLDWIYSCCDIYIKENMIYIRVYIFNKVFLY